jgi:pyruvate/2-oxoglutarate dehydrogenase complex dihydrolipoamide acyltransferase (E2) component
MADEKTPPVDSASAEADPAPNSEAAAAKAAPKAEAGAAPKAAPKKEKPPALEDKPFTEFIEQHFIPTLASALKEKGIDDIQLTLAQQPLGVFGVSDDEQYWHVKGQWQKGDGEASPAGNRQFNIAFTKDSISSPKLFYFADKGSQPSTIEQFMGDERKITLDLMVLFTLRRLNGQKWLARN